MPYISCVPCYSFPSNTFSFYETQKFEYVLKKLSFLPTSAESSVFLPILLLYEYILFYHANCRLDCPGIESWWGGARFSTPVQTGPMHWVVPGGKAARDVALTSTPIER